MMHRSLIEIIEDKKLNNPKIKSQILKTFLTDHPDTNLELVNFKNETAVTVAARLGDVDCLKLLINAKANIHHMTMHEMSPLMIAALYAKTECLLLLLNKGASINARDIHGHTALDLAVESKEANGCVRILLSARANPSWANRSSKAYIQSLISALENFNLTNILAKKLSPKELSPEDVITLKAHAHLQNLNRQMLYTQSTSMKTSNNKSLLTTVCLFKNKEEIPSPSKNYLKKSVNVKF